MKILRQHLTSRGGGIEVCLSKYGYPGEKMTAYQNYLGGGLLGRVCNDCTIPNWREYPSLVRISKKVSAKYAELMEIDIEDYETMPIVNY
jgi:hypothetical protein